MAYTQDRSWLQAGRLGNTLLWLYLGFSNPLQPITTGDDFWTAKWHQLFQFGPYGTLSEFLARFVIPGVLWLVCDLVMNFSAGKVAKSKSA